MSCLNSQCQSPILCGNSTLQRNKKSGRNLSILHLLLDVEFLSLFREISGYLQHTNLVVICTKNKLACQPHFLISKIPQQLALKSTEGKVECMQPLLAASSPQRKHKEHPVAGQSLPENTSAPSRCKDLEELWTNGL